MRRGNEALIANSATGQSLIRMAKVDLETKVYSKFPKFNQNCRILFRIPKVTQNNQSLFRMAIVVCVTVMKHITLTWLLARAYSEWPKFNTNSRSVFKTEKYIQNRQSILRITKVYSECPK